MTPQKLYLATTEVTSHWFTKSYVTGPTSENWFPEPGLFGAVCDSGLRQNGFSPDRPQRVRLVLQIEQPPFDTPYDWAYSPRMSWWVIYLMTGGKGFNRQEPRKIDRSIYPGIWWRPEYDGRVKPMYFHEPWRPLTPGEIAERSVLVYDRPKPLHPNHFGRVSRYKRKDWGGRIG